MSNTANSPVYINRISLNADSDRLYLCFSGNNDSGISLMADFSVRVFDAEKNVIASKEYTAIFCTGEKLMSQSFYIPAASAKSAEIAVSTVYGSHTLIAEL